MQHIQTINTKDPLWPKQQLKWMPKNFVEYCNPAFSTTGFGSIALLSVLSWPIRPPRFLKVSLIKFATAISYALLVCYLCSNSSCGDVGGAMLVMVMMVVVCMSTSPPVFLLIVLLLALSAALHSVWVGMRVGVCVGQQRRRRRQLLECGVYGFNPDHGLAQQVDGMGQSRKDELKTLLEKKKKIHKN